MVFRVFKTQLGKLFLFLIFISVGGLYFVFHKVTMIRDYYQYLVAQEENLQQQLSILEEFGAKLDHKVANLPSIPDDIPITKEPSTNYMGEEFDQGVARAESIEFERLRDKDHMKLNKVLESLRAMQNKTHNENCATSEPDWATVPKLSSEEKILIPVLTYGPNNQLRGFRSVRASSVGG